MAITSNDARFLFYARSKGVSFENTLMLGRLELYVPKKTMSDLGKEFANNTNVEDLVFKDRYSEPLFSMLGAKTTDSMDVSDYEKATVIHDLNKPIPESLKNKFTAIVDGGTIEHVFNFPIAIRNCMEALKVGGYYLGITPGNNTMGHGFYQFSPELFFNVFNKSNGFEVQQMIICTQDDNHTSDWYTVTDPVVAKSRVTLVNNSPTYLMVMARKLEEKLVFANTPQQSDYQALWGLRKALQENRVPPKENRIKYLYRKITPKFMRIFFHNVYDLFTKEKRKDVHLGDINADHFQKMEWRAQETNPSIN
jgi:hypothetical protein